MQVCLIDCLKVICRRILVLVQSCCYVSSRSLTLLRDQASLVELVLAAHEVVKKVLVSKIVNFRIHVVSLTFIYRVFLYIELIDHCSDWSLLVA